MIISDCIFETQLKPRVRSSPMARHLGCRKCGKTNNHVTCSFRRGSNNEFITSLSREVTTGRRQNNNKTLNQDAMSLYRCHRALSVSMGGPVSSHNYLNYSIFMSHKR